MLQLDDSLINMDTSAHAAESAASNDARKQRYFLPHSDDRTASLRKNDFLTLSLPEIDHDTFCLVDFHSDFLGGTSAVRATLEADMIETRREPLTMPPAEPAVVASPTASDSESSAPATRGAENMCSALPSKSVLDRAANFTVVDAGGRAIPFSELYRAKPGEKRRVMIIFIRHFFCGNCQEFIRTLISQMPPDSLPPNTSVAIIGCGSHTLIPSYTELLSCPYLIYADSTKKLFNLLGMKRTLSLGWHAPSYIQHSLAAGAVKSIGQAVKRLPEGDMLKAGDFSQNGGEYLFEVEGLPTRNTTQEHGYKSKGNTGLKVKVTFYHRMRNSRDHTEIPQLVKLLGLSESDERSRRARTKLDRRWTSAGTLGSLARSLSNRRLNWLERRNSSRLSGTRGGDPSQSSNPRDASRSSSPEKIQAVTEDGSSQPGQGTLDHTEFVDAVANTKGQQMVASDKLFSSAEGDGQEMG